MPAISNPKATIHELWQSFVPAIIALTGAVLIFRSIASPNLFGVVIGALSTEHWVTVDAKTWETLKDTEVLKLVPVLLLFGIAVTLYIFDRACMALGHGIPPYLTWHGLFVSRLDANDVFDLWRRLPADQRTLTQLQVTAAREVDRAKNEEKTRSFGWLEQRERQFSASMNVFAYCKALALWTWVCVFVRDANQRSQVPIAILWTLLLCVAAFVAAVRATYVLVDAMRERVRIATARLSDQSIQNADYKSFETLEAQIQAERRRSRGTFTRFSFGSVATLRRALRSI